MSSHKMVGSKVGVSMGMFAGCIGTVTAVQPAPNGQTLYTVALRSDHARECGRTEVTSLHVVSVGR